MGNGKGGRSPLSLGHPAAYRAGTVKDQRAFGFMTLTGFPKGFRRGTRPVLQQWHGSIDDNGRP